MLAGAGPQIIPRGVVMRTNYKLDSGFLQGHFSGCIQCCGSKGCVTLTLVYPLPLKDNGHYMYLPCSSIFVLPPGRMTWLYETTIQRGKGAGTNPLYPSW